MNTFVTKGQTRMMSDFTSNFSIAWLVFAFISSSDYSPKSIGGIIYGITLFMISFKLARNL